MRAPSHSASPHFRRLCYGSTYVERAVRERAGERARILRAAQTANRYPSINDGELRALGIVGTWSYLQGSWSVDCELNFFGGSNNTTPPRSTLVSWWWIHLITLKCATFVFIIFVVSFLLPLNFWKLNV